MVTAMGNNNSNGNGNGNGVDNGKRDGDGNCNGNGHGKGDNDEGRVASSCSGAQEPCQPIDALPPPLLFHIFAKVSLVRAWTQCLQCAALWQG